MISYEIWNEDVYNNVGLRKYKSNMIHSVSSARVLPRVGDFIAVGNKEGMIVKKILHKDFGDYVGVVVFV